MKNVLQRQSTAHEMLRPSLLWGIAALALTNVLPHPPLYWTVTMPCLGSGGGEAILQEAGMQTHRNHLSIESLETRLNLSSLGFRLPSFAHYQPSLHKLTEHSTLRVISLTKAGAANVPHARPLPVALHPAKKSIAKTHLSAKHADAVKTKLPAAKSSRKSTTPALAPVVVPPNQPASVFPPTTPVSIATPHLATLPPPTVVATISSPVVPMTAPSAPAAPAAPAMLAAPNALTPILAQLYGDDRHDDSGTIQKLIDTANADGITTITLPAGTFKLDQDLQFYGTGITFSGQGTATVLDVNNNFQGLVRNGYMIRGRAITVSAKLDSTPLMVAQPITADTVVFKGSANIHAGQTLFLSNGVGSSALVEKNLGGQLTANDFHEQGPDEFIHIVSITTDASGNTVAHLDRNVLGKDDYSNIAPNASPSTTYLHAVAVDTPADNLTVQNLDIKFTDMNADVALYAFYSQNLTVKNVNVLNNTKAGALGAMATVGCSGTLFENIVSPASIGLNSTRGATITNCRISSIAIEEASTDNLFTKNTLTDTTTCDFHVGDMPSERNTFTYNTLHGGVKNTGAIGIWEGVDNTVAFNTITGGDTWIWAGTTKGTIVHDNTGIGFTNFNPLGPTIAYNNHY